MIKVIGLFPTSGNGGISSWSRKFLATFSNQEFLVKPIDTTPGVRIGSEGLFKRIVSGFKALNSIQRNLEKEMKKNKPRILHTTSSGSIGAYRDLKVAQMCKRYGVKSILHCRYGRITEDLHSKGLVGYLLRKSMALFDQIWVLDSRSYATLKSIPEFSDKVYLTPNSIDVTQPLDDSPKDYKRVGFIGNLIPSKGLYELVEACTECDVRLDIIGPGTPEVIAKIQEIAGNKLDNNIFLHGKLPNEKAVMYMRELDIVALPTYYPWEAFPISILEAMSLSKMVISCNWAAIPDILTYKDGTKCGMLVEQKSPQAIKKAIDWCQSHPLEADEMRRKAYLKVSDTYRKEVIYNLYRELYRKLLDNIKP